MGNQRQCARPVLEGSVPQNRPSKNVDTDIFWWRYGSYALGAWWRLMERVRCGAPRFWHEVAQRQIGCFLLALISTLLFIVQPILVYGNRTLPFQYSHVYPLTEHVAPDQVTSVIYAVKDFYKPAQGEFQRFFTDSAGTRFYLGSHKTSYMQGLLFTGGRRFSKDWQVPHCAVAGPGLYEAKAEFWYNPFQEFWDKIKADQVHVKVIVDRVGPLPPECNLINLEDPA